MLREGVENVEVGVRTRRSVDGYSMYQVVLPFGYVFTCGWTLVQGC